MTKTDWLDEIEAQADDSAPYYLPQLVAEVRRLRSLLQTTEAARDEAVGIAAGLRDALAGRVTPLERIGSATEETCTCRFHTARRELKALQARAEAAESRLSSLTQAHARLIAEWKAEEVRRREWQAFNEAHSNIQPEDSANTLRDCADDLAAVAETTEGKP